MKHGLNQEAPGGPLIDPRRGDVETDASSTKQHSMLSLAGELLVEISLPKLLMAWTLLLVIPGLLLGLAPIAVADWVRTLSGTIAARTIGLWSLLVLAFLVALGWFGWRTLFRLVENSFWALNSVVVQPVYAATREVLRQLAEKLFAKRGSKDQSRGIGGRRRSPDLRHRATRSLSRLSQRRAVRQLCRNRKLAKPYRCGAGQ
jgi:hypothetical protein